MKHQTMPLLAHYSSVRREGNEVLRTKLNDIKNSLTLKTQRAVELASEKGASNWLTVIPIDEMGFTLNKGCLLYTSPSPRDA